jgi:uncharacterized protein (DUF2267 family)
MNVIHRKKANTWLARIAGEFAADDRRLAYRILRAWPHALRDRLTVTIAAHFAAQVPELLRGVFYDGWSPSRVPVKFGSREYVQRFARDAGIHDTDVSRAASAVTRTVRRHVSGGALDRRSTHRPPAFASSSSRSMVEMASAARVDAGRFRTLSGQALGRVGRGVPTRACWSGPAGDEMPSGWRLQAVLRESRLSSLRV